MLKVPLRLISILLLFCPMLVAQQQIIPNDPDFRNQISFENPGGKIAINLISTHPSAQEFDTVKGVDLDITPAWAITTGSKDVVVAILDDGFCYDHPDLKDNIWHNPGETGADGEGFRKETNGKDDDHNGYLDDVVGWDFAFDDPDVDCHIFDGMDKTRIARYGHSMAAMGIIGARGNNGLGVAGINWNVSMMLLKIGAQGIARGEHDTERTERAARAIRYAADNGARIINWSGFTDDPRPEKLQALHEAIEYAAWKNVLVVVAAGNSFDNLDDDKNCGAAPECFENENLMKVAEIDFRGELYRVAGKRASGSNYGVKRVDIAAVGQNYSTAMTSGGFGVYRLGVGTSDAAPVVSGVAALMLSVNPSLTAVQLKQVLLDTARRLPALQGKIKCGGMVDAYRAVITARGNR
jgi:thermitase